MLYNIRLLWNTTVEREEIKEAETHKELEEGTGQSDPLNLIFSYFDSRFQEIENEIRKSKDKEPAEKKRKIQVETFKQKDHRLQHESNLDIMENLQDIIGNISDKQDPVSTLFKAVISKLKKRKKSIEDSIERGWAVVAEYEKEPIGKQTIVSDVANKVIGDGHTLKENNHTTEEKIKYNTYTSFF